MSPNSSNSHPKCDTMKFPSPSKLEGDLTTTEPVGCRKAFQYLNVYLISIMAGEVFGGLSKPGFTPISNTSFAMLEEKTP